MAPRAENRKPRRPRTRSGGRGLFYPNEIVRILGLERIDYRQLRRLFRLVRVNVGSSDIDRKWTRLSFTELATLRVAIDLAGGVDALKRGSRLRLKPLEDACLALRETYGISNPLLHASLKRRGNSVSAVVDGVEFVPQSGQVLMTELAEVAVKEVRPVEFRTLRRIAAGEIQAEGEQAARRRKLPKKAVIGRPSAELLIIGKKW